MKRKLLRSLVFCLALIALSAIFAASAAASDADGRYICREIRCLVDADTPDVGVYLSFARDNTYYMFLPAGADYGALTFEYDDTYYTRVFFSNENGAVDAVRGVPADLSILFSGEPENAVYLTAETEAGAQIYFVTFMKSANIRSLHLVSDDAENYGRAYVDLKKANDKASGMVYIFNGDGERDFSARLAQIKGRGNTTFTAFQKKPYQLKLDKKAELIDGAGKAKKWVLLTNSADPTLLRNSITLNAAAELGLAYSSMFEPVDLYYDGAYRGSYLLTEKVETKANRVEIEDTDDLIEDANQDNPAYDDPVVITATTADGGDTEAAENTAGTFKYVKDLNEPAFPAGCSHQAYLLEFEQPVRYPDELTGFVTDRGVPIVTKTPEYLTKAQALYIAGKWQEFEDAVYSPDGYNAETGKYYYEYCDLDSLVKCYILNEFCKNSDYYFTSTYFYLPENADIFQCGPVWDYDLAYGIGYDKNRSALYTTKEYFYSADRPFGEGLIRIESFRREVQKQMSEGGGMYQAARHMFEDGGIIDQYAAQIYSSQRMNAKIWDITNQDVAAVKLDKNTTFDSAVADLKNYAAGRFQWLFANISLWNGDSYGVVTYEKALYADRLLAVVKVLIQLARVFAAMA